MKYYVTGDTHGMVTERLENLDHGPDDTALIILGDAGLNFYLNRSDYKNKRNIQNTGYLVYCVRGNHEERPENLPMMCPVYDKNIEGDVWVEPEFPNIRYLMDGKTYLFNNHPTLVIGGAYSVDKWYRLERMKNSRWTGWFKDEQLTKEEMSDISSRFAGNHFHFVLTHTCPNSWQPFDLFLSGLDQSTVDKTMEMWLDSFKDSISWDAWLFGHFHDDRLVRPGVEMYFKYIDDLEDIYKRWTSDDSIAWWMKKDPNYYIEKGDKE